MTNQSDLDYVSLSSEQLVYDLLAILPSESAIHFYVYSSLLFLTLLFVVGIPAVALLFAEHRPVAGLFFIGTNLMVFYVSFVVQLRRTFNVPSPSRLRSLASSFIGRMRKVPLLKVVASRITLRLGPIFQPFPDTSGTNSFFDFYGQCWHSVMGPSLSQPRLYWSYQDRSARAQVAGRSRSPIVAVSAGLVSLFPRQADVARVYLLHEFGHIFNQDLEVFAYTMAGSRACRIVILVSSALSGVILIPFFNGTILSGLILLVGAMWLLLMIALWILLARYAGVIVSIRELYADVQAVIWLPGLGAYRTILLSWSRFGLRNVWSRFRSLVSLRLIHLSPSERLSYLEHPRSLLYPRHRYYVLVALLLVGLQSNPFGEGYDNNWMRWSVLLAWSPICLAYLMNVGRAVVGLSLLPGKVTFASIARLSVGVSIILLLPMLKVSGIYGDVVLSFGNWSSFWLGVTDSARTLAAQWGHVHWACVPVLTFLWLSLSYLLAHSGIRHWELSSAKERITRCNAYFFAITLAAVSVETILLGIQDYGNVLPSFLDSFQEALGSFRPAPPLVGLCVLIAGSWGIWRANHIEKM